MNLVPLHRRQRYDRVARRMRRRPRGSFVRNDGTRDIFEQGAAFEVRTGTDPNGANPDIRIRIGTACLTNQLWFDPHPETRTDPIPANHIDALSVFIHEFGHAFAAIGLQPSDDRESAVVETLAPGQYTA